MNWTIQLRILYMAGFRLGPDTTRRVGEKKCLMIARDGLGEQRLPEEDQAFPSPGVSFLLCRCFPDEPRSWDRRPNVRQRQTTQCEDKTCFFVVDKFNNML